MNMDTLMGQMGPVLSQMLGGAGGGGGTGAARPTGAASRQGFAVHSDSGTSSAGEMPQPFLDCLLRFKSAYVFSGIVRDPEKAS